MATLTTTSSHQPSTTFPFNRHYHHLPPFFTLQPNLTTLASQLSSWSTLIQSYCRHHRIFILVLSDALSSPLFHNTTLNRRLHARDVKIVLEDMVSRGRAEWITKTGGETKNNPSASFANAFGVDIPEQPDADAEVSGTLYIHWRLPSEWAELIEGYVDSTGQRGTVLTVYELLEGDATKGQEWWGMERGLFVRCLRELVKRGKAGVFGGEGSEGVKIF